MKEIDLVIRNSKY